MALFAGITLLSALFGSISALVMGAGLAYVAFREIKGSKLLRGLDNTAIQLLSRNQLALAVVIVGYSGWSLIASLRTDPLAAMGGSTGDPGVDALTRQISSAVSWGVYGTMCILGILIPALTAWYYKSRGRALTQFKAHTPPWVVQALAAEN